MKPVLLGALAALALATVAVAQPLPSAEPPGPLAQPLPSAEPPGPLAQPLATPDFLAVLTQTEEFELQEGRLAATRAHSPAVRRAAEAVIQDHGRSEAILASAVRQTGLSMPGAAGLGLAQHQRVQQLQSAAGAAFDQAYVAGQVHADRATLSSIDSYLRDGQPGPIRQAAAKIRPVVQRRLALFRSLQDRAGRHV